ncbi:MAG: BON domain-containing protein [Labilithrix sp.]|nr:BON domain-containing protein [Labilithrix sp.]
MTRWHDARTSMRMDHRWDELLQAEHRRRVERGLYDTRRVEDDDEVEQRDRNAQGAPRRNRSPWEIGADHWDQRDLYTRNARIDERGYARGPAFHPEIGSYAYDRDDVYERELERGHRAPPLRSNEEPTVYEREAWPWLHYEHVQPIRWANVREWIRWQVARLLGSKPRARAPKGWRRSDRSIRDDVCDALAYDGRLDAREIEVRVRDGEVALTGIVRDREQKRLAGWLAEHVYGVVDVHNGLVVRPRETRGGGDDLGFALVGRAY